MLEVAKFFSGAKSFFTKFFIIYVDVNLLRFSHHMCLLWTYLHKLYKKNVDNKCWIDLQPKSKFFTIFNNRLKLRNKLFGDFPIYFVLVLLPQFWIKPKDPLNSSPNIYFFWKSKKNKSNIFNIKNAPPLAPLAPVAPIKMMNVRINTTTITINNIHP